MGDDGYGSTLLGAATGALFGAGATVSLATMGTGASAATEAFGGDIEMGSRMPTASMVAEEVADPRGYYTSSRIVDRPNIRFRNVPQTDDEFVEVPLDEEEEAEPAMNIIQQARAKAGQMLRAIKQHFGAPQEYEQLPQEADLEMGVTDADQAVTQAQSAVTEAQATADADSAAVTGGETELTSLQATSAEDVEAANAIGDELFSDSLGVTTDALADTGLASADAATSAAVDAGALDAGGIVGDVGAAEAVAAPLDVETLGLSAVVAGIGGLLGGLIGGLFHSDPSPGIDWLGQDQMENMLGKLDADGKKDTPTFRTIKKGFMGQRVALVTTFQKKQVAVARLTNSQMTQAWSALEAHPKMLIGTDPFLLTAMGFNSSLSKGEYVPGMYPFQPDVQPPIAPPTPPQSSTALQAAQAKLTTLKAKALVSQTALTTAKTNLTSAQAQDAAAKAKLQTAYAAAVTAQNAKQKAAVDAYNAQLQANLPAVAAAYNKSVAGLNIQMSLKADHTIPLLHYNQAQAYAQAKQTYNPVSTTMPSSTTASATPSA